MVGWLLSLARWSRSERFRLVWPEGTSMMYERGVVAGLTIRPAVC